MLVAFKLEHVVAKFCLHFFSSFFFISFTLHNFMKVYNTKLISHDEFICIIYWLTLDHMRCLACLDIACAEILITL